MIYLFFISTCFSVLFMLLLLSKKKKRSDHYFLASIFLLAAINSLYISLFYNSPEPFYLSFFSELNYAIPLLYGPMLYFYSLSITNLTSKFKFKMAWHFAPFIVFLGILLSPFITNYQLLESRHLGYPLIKIIITPFYLILVLIILKRYRIDLKDHFSYVHKMNHFWLSWIVSGAIILWVIAAIGYSYNEINQVQKALLYDFYVLSFLGIFLFFLAFIAFNKTDIMSGVSSDEMHPIKNTLDPQTVTTDYTDYNNDLDKLTQCMGENKPYLDPLLSIGMLSEITQIPQYRISIVLNKLLKQSFYEYINLLRIALVKEKLKAGEAAKFSILGIALDCGFNSKASFNRIFKKVSGMTPSQYLKSINSSPQSDQL